jgi:crotonobetainyl-CoA:carnitine CoA-transferase CaiB-like acyl-CoA transferase
MVGPLSGIRVLDLSRVLAGPLAAQSLADLGADVIKIERPVSGDETRSYPPFTTSARLSSYFLSVNRGKRSVTIDLSSAHGRQIVSELAGRSDVVIENFKAGSLDKVGLGYQDLCKQNPRLIYCSITGFGQTGPHRDRAGYDVVIQAMGGMMSITGDSACEPVKAGVAIADITTGLYATSAILAALYERESSRKGQYIDLALLDVQIACLINHASSYLMSGLIPQRFGNAHASVVPYQVFETADGSIVVAVANDLQFQRLVKVLDLPDLATDPRFSSNALRVENRAELVPRIQERLRTGLSKEWMKKLDKACVPGGPINSLDDVFSDPQVEAHDLVAEYPSPEGLIRVAGNPIRFSRTPVIRDLPPPELGAHTEEVLRDVLGRSSEEIDALRCGKVI